MRDEDGFAAFAAANGRRLRHAARLLTGDDGRAEDLVQTALARAYLRWDRIRADDPTAYVRRVMYTAHADWWRRKWRHEYATGDLPDRPAAGDHAAESAERDRLRAALALLTPRERAVVVLRFYDDLSERRDRRHPRHRGRHGEEHLLPRPDQAAGVARAGGDPMSELLRSALSADDDTPAGVDVAAVRARAGRLRRTRYAVTGAASPRTPSVTSPPAPSSTPRS